MRFLKWMNGVLTILLAGAALSLLEDDPDRFVKTYTWIDVVLIILPMTTPFFLGFFSACNPASNLKRRLAKAANIIAILFAIIVLVVALFEGFSDPRTAYALVVVFLFSAGPLANLRAFWRPIEVKPETSLGMQGPVAPLEAPILVASEGQGLTPHAMVPATIESPPPTSGPPPKGYLAQHWRGELPLATSYWLNGVLLTSILIVVISCTRGLHATMDIRWSFVLSICTDASLLAVSVWQIVGTWRSASKHTERGGSPGWAAAAKLALVLGILRVSIITVNTTIPQAIDCAKIIAGDTDMPSYEIRVLPTGTEIEFRGGIRAGSASALKHALEAAPQVTVLHINSGGGRIHEARIMARLVGERGMTTYSSEVCLSAATLVFLAGKERVIAAGAKMGFHSSGLRGATQQQEAAMRTDLQKALRLAEVDDAFIAKVLKTSNKDMWYPSYEEMLDAGVVTDRSYGDRFSVSGSLLQLSSPEVAEKAFQSVPGFRAFKEVMPDNYHWMMDQFTQTIKAGKSEGEAYRIVREFLSRTVKELLPYASDEALIGLRDLWIEQLKLSKDQDSSICLELFLNGTTSNPQNIGRIFPNWPKNLEMDALDKVVRSAAGKPERPFMKTMAANDLNTIVATLRQKHGDNVTMLSDQARMRAESGKACNLLMDLYLETQAIPKVRQGDLLRLMILGK
jgi:ATP-dependent protease ClpP protease subunit